MSPAKTQKRQEITAYFKSVAAQENAQHQKTEFSDLLDKTDKGRVLVTIPESIGDIFLATSTFESIKKKYPDYSLYVATKPEYKEILDGNKFVHRWIPYQPILDNHLWCIGTANQDGFFNVAYQIHNRTQRLQDYQGSNHLVEVYAKSSNSEVGTPFIYTSYFPTPEKYITFQAESRYNSKNYSYFEDVIKIIYPVLEKNNIKIVQIGQQNESAYPYTIDLRGKTNLAQMGYIIQNSQTHFGPDSVNIHVASHFNVPICGLYSCSSISDSGPFWGDKSKQILFESYKRIKNGKPSYAAEEPYPKAINAIKPEEIANAIFKLLNIDYKCPFETVYTGEKYCNKIVREFIPYNAIQVQSPETPMEMRMDIEYNPEVLAQQLSISKGIIVTNKPIDVRLLKQFKQNIAALVYIIDEQDSPQFILDVKPIGLTIVLISYLDAAIIQSKKINYYEHGKINKIEPEKPETIEKLRVDIDKLYYRSNKIVFAKDKVYMGNSARLTDKPITSDFEYQKCVDCDEFWKELPFCTIIKKI